MGRKQREKKERKQQQSSTHNKPVIQSKSRLWIWVIMALVVMLAAAAGIGYYYIRANRTKLVKMVLYSQATEIQQELGRRQAAFSLDESQRLREILFSVQQLSTEPAMDPQVAGQLNFILQVEKEIVKNGNLEPDELLKLENLTTQARQMQNRRRLVRPLANQQPGTPRP